MNTYITLLCISVCVMVQAQPLEQRIEQAEEQLRSVVQELRSQIGQLERIAPEKIAVPEPVLGDLASPQDRIEQLEQEINNLIKIVQQYNEALNQVADKKMRDHLKDKQPQDFLQEESV